MQICQALARELITHVKASSFCVYIYFTLIYNIKGSYCKIIFLIVQSCHITIMEYFIIYYTGTYFYSCISYTMHFVSNYYCLL